MPTYEYECTNCGHVFEMYQSITARPKRTPDEPCENCGQKAPIRRLIGVGGAVLFKGSGFYETDYRSENYKKAARQEKKEHSGSSDEPANKKPSPKPESSVKSTAKTASPDS